MAHDLIIRNGTVVDGTGAPRIRADVAISDGIITEVGQVSGSAKRTIDASDLIVAPGFIDPHTHYDAQICWDSLPTSSCWHGITTVVMGNCGVGLAPCRPEAREIAAWDLVNVEAIPFDVLSKGVTWDWESFPEYMDAAARRGPGLNLAFYAALTPFRHYVLGEDSMSRAATADETSQIARLLREAMDAGALGFTTTNAAQHIGYQGRPLACRNASRDELKAYANVLRDLGRGTIEVSLTNEVSVVDDAEYELMDLLLRESNRPVTWLALLNRVDNPEAPLRTLDRMAPLHARGAVPQVSCRPLIVQLDMRKPFMFANMACWNPVFNRSVEEQAAIYRQSAFRDQFRDALKNANIFTGDWSLMIIHEVENAALTPLIGRSVADIARERGRDSIDVFFELTLEDNLAMQFTYELFNSDESRTPDLICDPRTMIGFSDGGAHVDMFCDAGYATYLLGTWVRDKAALSLEQAVKRLTTEPAAFFGITQRGRIAPGLAADLAIFDLASVGSKKRGEMAHDLPGGGRRLVVPSTGIEYTIVNGVPLFERGKDSGARHGQVLRSGRA